MRAIAILKELADKEVLVSHDDGELIIEAPKGALTDEVIATIRANKPLLIAFFQEQSLLHGADGHNSSITKMEVSERHDIPLSFSQQRLWLIDQINNGSAEYNLPKAVRILGDFDVKVAEEAVARIIQRHEILRTRFSEKDGKPVQNIQQEFAFAIECIDLTECENKNQKLSQDLQHRSRKLFDLNNDLMVRVTYCQIDVQENSKEGVLLFNVHHIASDGWSTGILIREFVQEYESVLANEDSPIPSLPIQYGDFAKWQRDRLQGDVLEKQANYWKQQLSDVPAQHSLPLDFPRPTNKKYIGEVVTAELNLDLSQQLIQMAQANQTTLFVIFHAALALLMSRHSYVQDIVIGTPITNRSKAELQSLIGFFVNTLALRVSTGHESLGEYLEHVKDINREAQAHQDLPFEQIVDLCKIESTNNSTPLTQILLSVANDEDLNISIPGLKFSPVESSEVIAKFDLELSVMNGAKGIYLRWTYDCSLFTHSHVEQLNSHFTLLLQNLTQQWNELSSSAPLSKIHFLSQEEHHYLTHQLNSIAPNRFTANEEQALIHKVFEEKADNFSEQLAVVFEGQSLTYEDLNSNANQFAHYLLTTGVSLEEPIGLCIERSSELIIAMLAILKSGAAYVPMDPDWPINRIAEIARDSGIHKLIYSERISSQISELEAHAEQVEYIPFVYSSFNRDFGNFSDANPQLPGQSVNQLAYIIYTSGSTGKPKGVMVEHKNVLQLVIDEPCVDISPTDCMTYCANPAFDASTWEVWGGILNGAKLLIVSHESLMDVERFSDLLISERATIVQLTAGLFAQYGSQMQTVIPRLKYLLWGGDKIDSAVVKQVLENNPPQHLVHTYGPTETVAFTITHQVNELSSESNIIPIGKHTSRSQTFVLDKNQKLAPFGAVGELYIGGPGVARGYLNQPDLTNRSFITSDLTEEKNQKLYRTGDLVRYSAKGELIFVGRMDEQVKIRGFRIELGEIEYQLSQFDSVLACLVMIKKSTNNEKSVVAYIVPKTWSEKSAEELPEVLRCKLKDLLPHFMIPTAFIVLERFPLTANGKVDRKELLKNSLPTFTSENDITLNWVEKKVLQVWSGLLGLVEENIGINDDFFSLGGNSLRIAEVSQNIKEIFGIKLEYKDLFSLSTIRMISNDIIRKQTKRLSTEELESLFNSSEQEALLGEFSCDRKIILTMNLPYTRSDGGANKSNRILAESFVELGYQVEVITPALAVPSDITIEQLNQNLVSQGVEVEDVGDALHFQLNGVGVNAIKQPEELRFSLKQKILTEKPDWVFVSAEDSSQLILSAALEVAEDRVVYFAHTPQMLPFGDQSFYPGEKRKSYIAKAKVIVTISEYVANYIERELEHTNLITNHPPHYGDDFVKFENFNEEYILCVNPCQVKGISLLLALAEKHSLQKFAVVPSWGTTASDMSSLKQLANVTVFERQSDLNKLFEKVKLLLVPSLWGEGFGMITVDAMLRGIPVIASNVGGLAEAKMGTDYLINVKPITSYSDELNENYIPYADVPEQELADWNKAIEELTLDEQIYLRNSSESYNRATNFVSGLSVEPLHRKLEEIISSENRSLQGLEINEKVIDALTNKSLENLTNLILHRESGDLSLSEELSKIKMRQEYGVSFSQQQLLLLDMINTGYYGFILNSIHPLESNPDYLLLEQAIHQVVMRHEAFRTHFESDKSGFKQKISINPEFKLDIRRLEQSVSEEEVKAYIHSLMNKPFDLYQGPLFRIHVIEVPALAKTHPNPVLLVSMHHIISDRASMDVVINETITIYNSLKAGELVALEPLRFQYKEFAQWQLEGFSKFSAEKEYWSEKLSGNLAKLDLPTDYRRKAVKSYSGFSVSKIFSEQLSNEIKNIAGNHKATSLIVMIALIKSLLHKYCNEQDIIVGIPASGRIDESLDGQVGFYINMLPIRDVVHENDSFKELLDKVKSSAISAYDNQLYPFSLMIEDNPGSYDPSRSPIFDVMVALDYLDKDYIESQSNLVDYQIDAGSSHDISFLFTEYKNRIVLKLTYDRTLYQQQTIQRLINHLTKIATQVCQNDKVQLSQLELLTPEEKVEIQELNKTRDVKFDSYITLHQRFTEIANKFPERKAVECGYSNKTLTYEQLNQKVNQLSNRLVSLGANQKSPVAIVMSESVESVIAILAVLKSGSFYLPINPAYPEARIIELIGTSDANIVLFDNGKNINIQSKLTNVTTLAIDDSSLSLESDSEPNTNVNAEDLAYVLFTSGTTAKPKGVMVKHSNVTRLFFNETEDFSFSENDVWTMFHSICFDFSVWEMFGALLYGGKLIVVNPDMRSDISSLLGLINQHQVTVLNQVPNVFYNLVSAAQGDWQKFSSLRYVIFGGDKLEPNKLGEFNLKYPEVKLINMYGITETAIHTTFKQIQKTDIESGISNIGKPLPTVSLYVLDSSMNLLPDNAIGELYVGGAGITKGYLNAQKQTTEKFLDSAIEPNTKLYKTGDLARRLSNGEYEYLGRIDNQVNIRGFRVGIGEIEYQLGQLDVISQAIVSVKQDGDGNQFLVAHMVGHNTLGKLPESNSEKNKLVRKLLSVTLPNYMIPSVFMWISEIPLTSNGKVDRKKLSQHNIGSITGSENSSRLLVDSNIQNEKLSELQRKLLLIWSKLLGTEPQFLGLDSNFYELGGHSLLLVKMSTEIKGLFNVDLPLKEIMEAPFFGELCELVERRVLASEVASENTEHTAEDDVEIEL